MATITLNVNDKINDEFRQIVKSKLGESKGMLGKAIEEAITKWMFVEKQKELSNEGLMMLKEGIWSKKGYKFNREDPMTDKPIFLLDSNILVYAHEKEESKRREVAKKILEECYNGKILLAISNQNIAEFTSVMLKKIKVKPEIIKKVIDITSEFNGFIKLKYELKTIKEAINLSDKYNMSFWDSLIAATMIENGILNIYTENVKDFKIPSLNIINPLL